jgi:hypothetical protein
MHLKNAAAFKHPGEEEGKTFYDSRGAIRLEVSRRMLSEVE